jgi:hypothetical protein
VERSFSVSILVNTIGNPAVHKSSYVLAATANTPVPMSMDGREVDFISFLILSNSFGFALSGIVNDIPFLKAKKSFMLIAAITTETAPAIFVIIAT